MKEKQIYCWLLGDVMIKYIKKDIMNNQPKILTFAASDPTGGAGIQADIMTQSSIGCYPLTVITGLTVQDTAGVYALQAIKPSFVEDQARAILDETEVSVIKCGLLSSENNIKVIAKIMRDYSEIPIIVDPIIASGRGDTLTNKRMMDLMKSDIFPQCELITPNVKEAAMYVNLGDTVIDINLIHKLGGLLQDSGASNVLITGADNQPNDLVVKNILFGSAEPVQYEYERLSNQYHGSGCTLTSAISAFYALGLSLESAVAEAQDFVWQSLKHSLKIGKGQDIPNRFYWMNDEAQDDKTHH